MAILNFEGENQHLNFLRKIYSIVIKMADEFTNLERKALHTLYIRGTLPVYRLGRENYEEIIEGNISSSQGDESVDLIATSGTPNEISKLKEKELVNFEPPMYYHISEEGVEMANKLFESGENTELWERRKEQH